MDETEMLHMVCESEDGPYVKEEEDEEDIEYFKEEPVEEEEDYFETGFLVKQEVLSEDEGVNEEDTMFAADVNRVKPEYEESLFIKIEPKPESEQKSVNAQILQMLKRKQETDKALRSAQRHAPPRPIQPKPIQPKPTTSTPPPTPNTPSSSPYQAHTICYRDSQTPPVLSNPSAPVTNPAGCLVFEGPKPTVRCRSQNTALRQRGRQRKIHKEAEVDATPPPLTVKPDRCKRQRKKKDLDDVSYVQTPPLTVTQIPGNMSAITSQGVLQNSSSMTQSGPGTIPAGALLQVPGLPKEMMLVPVLQGNQLMFMPQAVPGAMATNQIATGNAAMATGQIATGNDTMATGQIATGNTAKATGQVAAGNGTMATGQMTLGKSVQGNQVVFMSQAAPVPMATGQILSQTGIRATGQLLSPTGTMATGQFLSQTGTMAMGPILSPTGNMTTGQIVSQTETMATGQFLSQTGTMAMGPILSPTGNMTTGQIVSQTGTMATGQIVSGTGMVATGPIMSQPRTMTTGRIVSQTGTMATAQIVRQTGIMSVGQVSVGNNLQGNKVMLLPKSIVGPGQLVSQAGGNQVMLLPPGQTTNQSAANPFVIIPNNPHVAMATNKPQVGPNHVLMLPGTTVSKSTFQTATTSSGIAMTPTSQPRSRINSVVLPGVTDASVTTSQTVTSSATMATKQHQVGTNPVVPATTAVQTSTAQSLTRMTTRATTCTAMKSLLTKETITEACKRRRRSKLVPMEDSSGKNSPQPVSSSKTIQTMFQEDRKRRRKSELVPKEDFSSDETLRCPQKKLLKLPRQILPKPVVVSQTVEEPVLNKIMNWPSMFPETSVVEESDHNLVLPPVMIRTFTVPTAVTNSSSSNPLDSSVQTALPIKTSLVRLNPKPATTVDPLSSETSNTAPRKHQHILSKDEILPTDDFTRRARKFCEQYVKLIMYFDSDYECDLCSQLFETKHHLALHVYEHTDDDINTFLNAAFSASRDSNNGQTERLVCDQCSQEFECETNLRNHQKVHTCDPVVIQRKTCKKGIIDEAKISKMVAKIEIDPEFCMGVDVARNDKKRKGLNLRDLANAILKPLRPPEADNLDPPKVMVVDNPGNQYPDPAAYCCRQCLIVFENFDDLVEHMSLHDEEGVAIATTYEKVGVKSEQRSYDNVDPSKNKLLKKIKTEAGESVPVTSEDMLQWRKVLFNNIATDTEQKYDCISCSETIYGRTSFLIHLVCHGIFDRGSYYCNECWKAVFVDYNDLVCHRRSCPSNSNSDPNLKCKICDAKKFEIPCELDQHYRDTHKVDFPYVCTRCPFVSSVYLDFASHEEFHADLTQSTMFTCLECGEKFEAREEYEEHERSEHGLRNTGAVEFQFKCEFCDSGFTVKEQLEYHIDLRHIKGRTSETENAIADPGSCAGEKPPDGHTFRCKGCPKTYKNQTSYESHVKAYPLGQFRCSQCTEVFEMFCGLLSHRRSHEKRRKNASLLMNLFCKKCGKLFRSSWPSRLKWHEKTCSGHKSEDQCKKVSTHLKPNAVGFKADTPLNFIQVCNSVENSQILGTKPGLKTGDESSTNHNCHPAVILTKQSEQFTCLVCGEKFESEGDIELHDRTKHGGGNTSAEKSVVDQFRCGHFEKGFNFALDKNQHIGLVHSQETVTNECVQHTGNHAEAPPDSLIYHCAECRKTFKSRAFYEAHMQANPIGQYKCSDCTHLPIFERICGLTSHTRTMHRNKISRISFKKTTHNRKEAEGNFSCSECLLTFQKRVYYDAHILAHPVGRFPCLECPGLQVFERMCGLKWHKRSHPQRRGIRPKISGEKVSSFSKDAVENISSVTTVESKQVSGKNLNSIVPAADSALSGPISASYTKLGEVQGALPRTIKFHFVLTPPVRLPPRVSVPSSSNIDTQAGNDDGKISGATVAKEKRLSSWKNSRKARKVAKKVQMIFECDQCGKRFARHSTLVSHKATRHDDYTDDETDVESGAWSVDSCHGDGGSVHDKVDALSQRQVGEAQPNLKKNYIYKCDQCSKSFARRSALVSHKATHHDDSTDDDGTDVVECGGGDSDNDVMDPLLHHGGPSSTSGNEAH
ncbi:uncharacterized protein LOC135499106 [Lineus longissimus]|uniref:uncharacterized protein LOC135499106 n=1 Tax=Lineus longissimus TaxID=88925 RepID=UPI00315CAFFA